MLVCTVLFVDCALGAVGTYKSTKPAQFGADSAECSQQKNGETVCNYAGNAVFDQVDSHLTAPQIDVYRDLKGSIYQIIAFGGRAHFATKMQSQADGNQRKAVVADANSIKFLLPKSLVVFIGDAKIVRDGDIFTGPYIEYDVNKETILSKPIGKDNLTTIILQPKKS